MAQITVYDHPLIQHFISTLRDENTDHVGFRESIRKLSVLLGYEALRDLPMEEITIKTPIEECTTPVLAREEVTVVPILRAGISMLEGFLSLIPDAKVGLVGLYRDEETFVPHEYLCKLPPEEDMATTVILDPMLATGGSAVATLDLVKEHGAKNIKYVSIISAPEGLDCVTKAHPDVQYYTGVIDRELNENAYICPGLGDAGDRYFGTD